MVSQFGALGHGQLAQVRALFADLLDRRVRYGVARVQVQVLDVGAVQRQEDYRPVVDLPAAFRGHATELRTPAGQRLDAILRDLVAPRDVDFSQVLEGETEKLSEKGTFRIFLLFSPNNRRQVP